jgi:hypothetical protein
MSHTRHSYAIAVPRGSLALAFQQPLDKLVHALFGEPTGSCEGFNNLAQSTFPGGRLQIDQ